MNASISRRSLLKLGAISGVLLALPMWSSRSIAQSLSSPASKGSEIKPEGLVSFNAGWVIPLEDKSALLALEEKKIKEAQASTSTSNTSSGDAAPSKAAKKSLGDKAQEVWSKLKSFF